MHSTRRLNTPGIKSSSYYKEFQCTVARQQVSEMDRKMRVVMMSDDDDGSAAVSLT